MIHPELHEKNRLSWNSATAVHNLRKHDQAGFLRGGGSTLFDDEVVLLGDVRGLEVLHLLCNSGQDTLGIAALGATMTGVDISDEAISFATQLSADTGIPATFERSDVYPWLDAAIAAGKSFDVVFCSYGALCWLSDLDELMRRVAAVLRPGGRFVCLEFHPLIMIFDEKGTPTYHYSMPDGPLISDGVSDYVGFAGGGLSPSGNGDLETPFKNPHPAFEFLRGLSEILGPVLKAGLTLREFREYLHSNGWKPFEEMKPLPGRRWTMPEGKPAMPLMYGVVAVKG